MPSPNESQRVRATAPRKKQTQQESKKINTYEMTSKSAQFAALIGIDWASQRHALCLYDCATAKRESSILEHTPEAIAQWARGLQERFKGKEDRSLSGAKQRPAHLRTLGAGRTLLTKASSNMPASRCSIAAGPSSISRNRWRVAKLIPPPSAPWPSSGSAIMFVCWRDRVPYDETIYRQSLQRRGSHLARKLN